MKFKSIKLHNFMRYKGDNEIKFSCDPNKNVTVVLGDNTFGKTTIAQAFRWGLYEELNTTNYANKKDIVLLNNEVIASMSVNDHKEVSVEITVEDEGVLYEYTRSQIFRKKNSNPYDLSITPLADARLTMRIIKNGIPSEIINNDGDNGNKTAKEYPKGSVQDSINTRFPVSLSNYFFFDGERWNNLKNKTNDIKDSINTILGVTPLIKMKEHLREGTLTYKKTVIKTLRENIKGVDGEYEKLQNKIDIRESELSECEAEIRENEGIMESAKNEIHHLEEILNNNKSLEADQRDARRLESDIANFKKFQNTFYSDIVKQISRIDKLFASQLLMEIQKVFSKIDLKGRDIPGVTSDTIDYLLKEQICLCGEPLDEGSPAYENLLKLREEVYPKKIGGPAKGLEALLTDWQDDSIKIINEIIEKSKEYEENQDIIEDKEYEYNKILNRIDKKTNMEDVRKQYQKMKNMHGTAESIVNQKKSRINTLSAEIKEFIDQQDEISKKNEKNTLIYRSIAYAEKLYQYAANGVKNSEGPILDDLNKIISDNFEKMFQDKEKYAKLEDDYKIHMYYRQIGEYVNFEEENLSNGEMIAINFVFIVSILELAKRRKREADDKDNTILNLPLVLDAPFSNLSNSNTGLVARRLPEFAEQVIVFMLDKDWEASGLEEFTDKQYCYRVNKESKSNSSSLNMDVGEALW